MTLVLKALVSDAGRGAFGSVRANEQPLPVTRDPGA